MIKTLIFDYGGVLGNDAEEWRLGLKEIPEITGLTPEELDGIWVRHWQEVKRGKKKLRLFWEDVVEASEKEIDVDLLEEAYERGIFLDSDVFDYVKEMKNKGFDIVMLSNESGVGMDIKIEKYSLNDVFSKIYCSAYIGMAKPDKEIFEYVLSELGLKGNEVVFIDNQENNILVAKELGINSVLFKNLEQLKEELSNL